MSQGSPADSVRAPVSDVAATDQTVEALRDILRIISQSHADEKPVLEAIVRNAARLCDSPDVGLHLVNEARTRSRLVCVSHGDQGVFEIGQEFDLDGPHQTPTAIRESRVIHNPDIADDPLYREGDPIRVKLVDVDGVRSRLSVPLLRDGVAFGCINLNRHQVRPFTDAEIALIEAFAAQAVIAIENVRQFRELQNRLERETAVKNILRVISESRDDEAPVFEAILDCATRLCGTQYASLILGKKGDAAQVLAANREAIPEAKELYHSGRVPMDPSDSLAAQAIIEGRTIHIPDMADTPQYRAGHERFVILVDRQGLRTNLFVPLMTPAGGIGCFIIWKKERAPFTDDQIALIETFAAHAVIAIENVRQFRELQTRLEREAASREILSVISQSRDDDAAVFDTIFENLIRLCATPQALLMLVSEDGSMLEFVASRGAGREELDQFRIENPIPVDAEDAFAKAFREQKSISMSDLMVQGSWGSHEEDLRAAAEASGVRSFLITPLVGNGRSIGALAVYRHEVKPFTLDEVALVETFAAQAVIAIENVRQFRELQTRLEREEASRQILGVISSSPDDEQPVFDTILRNASRLCGGQDARLMLVDEARENFVFTAVHGNELQAAKIGEAFPLAPPYRIAETIRTGKTIIILDMKDTDAYRAGVPTYVKLVDEEGLRTRLIVPLLRGDVAIGCIVLSRHEVRTFNSDEIALIETFAAQAVIAIENVRQFRALEALNAELGDRVEEQVGEIERMGRLKRFLPPAVADAVIMSGDEKMLGSHRALIAVLFCDIRGFTAFCETAEPEETIEMLQNYHEEMGGLLTQYGVGVDHRSGDGIMAIFNDPLPCEDPAGTALRMALAMRDRMAGLCQGWKRLGHRLGFGVGISLGYATVGMVGSEGRFQYTASGTTVNLAARLCDEAEDGQILISPRAFAAVEDDFEAAPHGDLSLKGIAAPVEVYRVIGPKTATARRDGNSRDD